MKIADNVRVRHAPLAHSRNFSCLFASPRGQQKRAVERPFFLFVRASVASVAALASAASTGTVLAIATGRTTLEALLGFALGARDLLAGRLVDDLHGEPHLAAVVEAEQLDEHFLALLDDIIYAFGPARCQLGDVHESVLGTEEVHEGAELHDLDDLALVDLADLGLRT